MGQVAKYFLQLPFLVQLDSLSILLPIVVAIFLWRRLDQALRIFFFFQVISLAITIWMTFLAANRRNNLWLIQIQTPIEFGFLIWIFSIWQTNSVARNFYRLTIPVFVSLWALLAVFFEKFGEFNTVSKPTEAILLIGASAYSLYQVNKEKIEALFVQPSFWIGSGALIYFTGTVLFFAVTNLLLRHSPEELRIASFAVSLMNTVANILYARGFLCKRLTQA